MIDFLFNSKNYQPHWSHYLTRVFIISTFLCLFVLAYHSDANAQKKSNNPIANTSPSEDEKKFDMLKGGKETIWTCENNVRVKTAHSGNSYLFLYNKKLYTMNGIDALNGVSRFSDIVHRIDWFIIPGKAMLFDSKVGQRLLDYCQHPELAFVDKSKETDLMK